jgi:hypothetical protein
MNAQYRERVDRGCEKIFPMENDILSPKQQITCIFVVSCGGTSSASLYGISREFAGRFSFPILRTGISQRCRAHFSVPVDSSTSSHFERQLSDIY